MNGHFHYVGRMTVAAVTRTVTAFSKFCAAMREARELEAKLSRDRYPFIDA